jgi:serine protease Do
MTGLKSPEILSSPAAAHGVRRRKSLLAGVAGLAIAGLLGFAVVTGNQRGAVFQPGPAHAETARPLTAPHPVQAPVSFADIVERVKPAVVSVRVKVEAVADRGEMPPMPGFGRPDIPEGHPLERFFRRFGGPEGGPVPPRRGFGMSQGSGFFISADGYVVTNNHVVANGKTVEVVLDDGRTYDAKVVGTDPKTDLALLKVEGGSFPFVELAKGQARVGEWVMAVGNPFGLGGTVTAGIVSARGRDIGSGPYDDYLQIDAAVNRGNSGGPTFDLQGRVVGVNTAIFSPSGGNVGIAFAIPASTVELVVAQLKDTGTVTRGFIGVQIQPVTPDIADGLGLKPARGALVASAQDGRPAAKAGIRSGDVILSVDGAEVKDSRDLAKKVAAVPPGRDVKLEVWRDGRTRSVSVEVARLPGDGERAAAGGERSAPARLGLSLAPAGEVAGTSGKGVAVVEVDPSGPAAEKGFRPGDVILEVAGASVRTPSDVNRAVETARKEGRKAVLMQVERQGDRRFVAIPLAG